jgi:hypothetical protein
VHKVAEGLEHEVNGAFTDTDASKSRIVLSNALQNRTKKPDLRMPKGFNGH